MLVGTMLVGRLGVSSGRRFVSLDPSSDTPNLPTNITPTNFAWLKLSGKSPTGLGIPPLLIKIMLESNPLKSTMLAGRLAVPRGFQISCTIKLLTRQLEGWKVAFATTASQLQAYCGSLFQYWLWKTRELANYCGLLFHIESIACLRLNSAIILNLSHTKLLAH